VSDASFSELDDLPPALARRLEEACDRFEAGWRGGVRPQLDDFLASTAEGLYPVLLRELILLDVFYRRQAGECPCAEDYQTWLPDLHTAWFDAAMGDAGATTSAVRLGDTPPIADSPTEAAVFSAQAFGDYELLGEIARGGMGVVYKARQTALKRLVALKMIRTDLRSDAARQARFQTEAEAVARLRHPNIVQIYEVGQYQGQPFLSLEFMEGGSLQQALAGTPLPFRQAARLLLTLAGAIEHAHQQGILHRDLKPANVLLSAGVKGTEGGQEKAIPTSPTSAPWTLIEVKVADFGLAKHLHADSGQTESGTPLGTPSYMAPELAEGKSVDVGPATDVYGLGAILYEALTGRPPFKATTALETVQQVCTQEPVPPSRLQPHLPRDLEIICLKCLAKEPRKRYPSAGALAEDLGRFLDGRSIQARPAPGWERVWKWARRRPLAATSVAVAAVAVLALLGVWAIFTVQLQEARLKAEGLADERQQQWLRAESEWRRAEANQEKTLEAVDRFLTRVGDKTLADIPAVAEVRRDLLTDALQFFQKFLDEKENPDPSVRRQAALAAQRAYRIYNLLGQSAEQYEATKLTVDLFRQLAAEFPEDPSYRHGLSQGVHALGQWHSGNGPPADRAERAVKYLHEALELRQELVRQHPDLAAYRDSLARTYIALGLIYQRIAKRLPQVEKAYQDALDLRLGLVRDYPTPEYQTALADLYTNLATFAYRRGRLDEAEQYWGKARATYEPLAKARPGDLNLQDSLARMCEYLGIVYTDRGQTDKAIQLTREGLTIHRRLARDYRSFPAYRHLEAQAYNNLGRAFEKAGRLDERLEAIASARDSLRELVQDYPKSAAYQFDFAKVSANLGQGYSAAGKRAEMEQTCKEAVAVMEPLARSHPKDMSFATELGRVYLALSDVQLDGTDPHSGQPDWAKRAVDMLEDVVRQAPSLHETRESLSEAQVRRAVLLLKVGQSAPALAALERVEQLGIASRDWLRVLRAAARVGSGDQARAVDEIKVLDVPAFLEKNALYHLYLAGIYGGAATAVERDAKLSETERDELAERYDARAVALLARYLAQDQQPPPADVGKWPTLLKANQELKALVPLLATPHFAFVLARGYARAAVAEPDVRGADPERARKIAALDRQALTSLQYAHARGYFTIPSRQRRLKSDPDFRRLMERPEYQQLLSDAAAPRQKP
jgi:tetratricopeptide (TPR) repeat protein